MLEHSFEEEEEEEDDDDDDDVDAADADADDEVDDGEELAVIDGDLTLVRSSLLFAAHM
jgi:hypothetical protein